MTERQGQEGRNVAPTPVDTRESQPQLTSDPASAPKGSNSRSRRVDIAQKYGVPIVWLMIIIIFSVLRPERFPTTGNLRTILASQSVLVVVTLALILSLAVGEFDLSVGAVLGFAAIMIAYLNGLQSWPIWLAIPAVLAMVSAFGGINAFLSVYVGVPSIIVTLGTGTLLTGLGLGISGSQIISGVSSGFVDFMIKRLVFGLPFAFFFGLALAAVIWFVFQQMPLGRYMVFIAEGRDVARLAGIRVQVIRAGALIATSLFAGVAGVLLVGGFGAANPSVGNNYLLPAFAAAFLGSTTIVPGRFNSVGTVIAVYFLVTGITGLQLMGLAGWIEQVFYGGSLVLAVTLSQWVGTR